MKLIFWLSLGLVFYTFLGYGIVLYILVRLKRVLGFSGRKPRRADDLLPSLSLVVAAYNEESIIETKIRNTLALDYPADRLRIIFVTDGSSDLTPQIVSSYPEVELMHAPERKGKIHAIHRVMEMVDSEIVVFTDANAILNQPALVLIAGHYADPLVGAVSGEKRVSLERSADATAGEGFYWKYESLLKKWDSELYSVVGAAGELFSVRRALYNPVPGDTILDDFMISMLIAGQGYRIVYEPDAYAVEDTSDSIKEELKRKVRIAAGGIQSVLRLLPLLNPLKFPVLFFQYVSHRVLRWTVTPFALVLALATNILICLGSPEPVYRLLLAGQVLFYAMALLGWWLERRAVKIKAFFVPYYFCMMNYSVLAGIFRFLSGNQSAVWEKAKRRDGAGG
ncbi:glycosyltransferase family 2 protein [Ravibacter arvi]|uniref:Glycosyltransferase family 2 protein n=1 Tax=Ravibacter arvi TaxID=2051041 RepID=A0ABP8M3Z9_9BACT